MLLDDILVLLGEYGPFQRRISLLISLIAVLGAFHTFAPVFLSAEIDHWCSAADYETDFDFNCTSIGLESEPCVQFVKNVTIPSSIDSNKVVYEQCQRYDLTGVELIDLDVTINTTQTQGCVAGWTYDRSQYKSTTVQDFTLVCDRKNLVNYANAAYFAGFLVGAFFFGNLSDRIGRYPTYFITIGLWTIFGIISAFSPNFITFAVMRFFIGATKLTTLVAFIVCSEIVGPSKRPMAGNVIWLIFAGGYMLLAIIAYFIRDWRHLQLAISVPLVLFFLLAPVLCESPRWLISRGRYDKAEKILRKAAKENKVELPAVLFDEPEGLQTKKKPVRGKPWDLFRTPNLRAKTLNIFYNWFVHNMVYYGLSLSTSGLGVNPYIAAFVSGAVEIPAYLSCWFALDKFGRRFPLCIYMVVGGVACVCSGLIPPGIGRTVLAMIGKFGITGSFSIIYIFTGEIFPTPVRSIGMGMASMNARISGIIAPFILILGDYWGPLPFIIFGANSILAGLLALLLPETHNTNLPQTLEEGEEFGKNKRDGWPCLGFSRATGKDTDYKPAPMTEGSSPV